jgi:hypothetical protein
MHPFASAGVAAVLTASAAKHAKILVFMRNHPVLPLASSTNPEAQGWVPRLEAEHLLDVPLRLNRRLEPANCRLQFMLPALILIAAPFSSRLSRYP